MIICLSRTYKWNKSLYYYRMADTAREREREREKEMRSSVEMRPRVEMRSQVELRSQVEMRSQVLAAAAKSDTNPILTLMRE